MRFDTSQDEANIEAGNDALLEMQINQWYDQRRNDLYLESIGQGFDYWELQWQSSLEHERMLRCL